MRQIPTSPFPSGGRNPVAEAVSTDYSNLYVVNQDDNTIVQFVIGPDGKLYPQNTVNTPGNLPARRCGERVEPVCAGHLPAASDLLQRGTMLGFGGRLSDPARLRHRFQRNAGGRIGNASRERKPELLAADLLSYTDSGNSSNCETVASSDVIAPTAINVLASGRICT